MQYKVVGNIEHVILTRCIDHSKQIKEGDIFVCQTSNRLFVAEAIQKGAIAVVSEKFIADCFIPQIIIPTDMRLFMKRISTNVYNRYGSNMKVVGVTGTNGKTTVTSFIAQLLMQQNKSVCMIGTLGVYVNGKKLDLFLRKNTTLPFFDFMQVVTYCTVHQVEYIVLEASSQGLLEERLGNYPVDVGVFLNIGKDHLEFHGGEKPYKKSKQLLTRLSKKLIINQEDEWCRSVANNSPLPIIRFGQHESNDIVYEKADYTKEMIAYKFLVKDRILQVEMNNSGYYNGMNLAAAIATMHAFNIPLEEIKEVKLPQGRLERIKNNKGINVLVDYAHTPDALEASISAIQSYAKKNVYVVFGCGGNRDKQKRREMGEIATKYATKTIVTSDNPRNESPEAIIEDIVRYVEQSKVLVEKDRKQAIILALSIAAEGDVVLIAGKGHEQEQIIHDLAVPFSDQEVVRDYFEALGGVITKNEPVA